MIIPRLSAIESRIVDALSHGSIKTTDLVKQLQTARPNTTKQSVYSALRQLKSKEVVLTFGMQSSLNARWLERIEEYLAIAQNNYYKGDDRGKGNYYNLNDGERIEYFFQDLVESDSFWWQALYQLTELSKTSEPVFLWNPHEWFFVARKETELEVIEYVVRKNKQILITTWGTTAMDKYITNYFDGNMSQYHMSGKVMFKKLNYYFNIVDDFIIEGWINQKLVDNIEELYNSTPVATNEAIEKLKQITSEKGKWRLVISRDRKKTEKYKKILSKHFYIKKDPKGAGNKG